MIRQNIIMLAVLAMVIMFAASCAETEDPLVDISFDGTILLTSSAVDENMIIEEPETVFEANEKFYFYISTEGPFAADHITVQLICSATERVMAETDYPVDFESAEITDMIWFSGPGRYRIAVSVDGEIRAVREIVIE